jgi:hypothetical protein
MHANLKKAWKVRLSDSGLRITASFAEATEANRLWIVDFGFKLEIKEDDS